MFALNAAYYMSIYETPSVRPFCVKTNLMHCKFNFGIIMKKLKLFTIGYNISVSRPCMSCINI